MVKLTDYQFAVMSVMVSDLCAYPFKPVYRFVGPEKKVCEGLVKRGLLRRLKEPNKYEMTEKGKKLYKQYKLENFSVQGEKLKWNL